MAFREGILIAILIALGAVAFREKRAQNARRLEAVLERKRGLATAIRDMKARCVALRAQIDALQNDPYYIERVAREELGWVPPGGDVPGDSPGSDPPPGTEVTELARVAPGRSGPPREGDGRSPQRATQPPNWQEPDENDPAEGQGLLATLGYDSASHFQRKMMSGRRTGVLDEATRTRARQVLAMLRGLGCESVKEFQLRHGLTTDGVIGRRTERCARELLRAQRPCRRPWGRTGVVAHRDGSVAPRPGG